MSRKTNKRPPDRFAWFLGYHVFDLVRARALAADKPVLLVPTVCIPALLEDGKPDRDIVRTIDVSTVAILARVPMGDGRERYVMIDGYEVAYRCLTSARSLRVRILTKLDVEKCRIHELSLGDW